MNSKKRLQELIKKNPLHKKLIDSNKKMHKMMHKQTIQIRNAIKSNPMVELFEMQHLMNAKPDEFNPEGDFTVINFDSEKIFLSPTQALAAEYMFNEHKKGRKSIYYQDILSACNSSQTSLHQLFKRNKDVMGNLIKSRKSNY